MPDTPKLTIAYLTARQNPLWRWFVDSLARQAQGDYSWFEVVVIDFWADAHAPGDGWTSEQAAQRRAEFAREMPFAFRHSSPMWGVWNGPHRLTRDNWFAKPDALNTAICLSRAPVMACFDDLSVLMPGTLAAVKEAALWNGVTCGAYRKERNMVVEDGVVLSSSSFEGSQDRRWDNVRSDPSPCRPNWMFGHFVVPIDAVLKANGWPQYANGMGYEDTNMGEVIGRNGVPFRYDRRLLVWESDEHHTQEKNMRRGDPFRGEAAENPRDDKSHALKRMAEDKSRLAWTENFFGLSPNGERELTLRELRESVQSGGSLPVLHKPTHEPFSGIPLGDLHQPDFVSPKIPDAVIVQPKQETPAIFDEFALCARLPGWCSALKAEIFCSEIERIAAKTVVEIGVFGGKSLIPMALRLKKMGAGKVIGIDPWSRESATEGYVGKNLEWWSKIDYDDIRLRCHRAVSALNLDGIVTLVRSGSDDVTPPDVIDFLHIDGQHSMQAVRDVERFASRVPVGGLCFLNDIDWEGGAVWSAAAKLLELGFCEKQQIETGALFERL